MIFFSNLLADHIPANSTGTPRICKYTVFKADKGQLK